MSRYKTKSRPGGEPYRPRAVVLVRPVVVAEPAPSRAEVERARRTPIEDLPPLWAIARWLDERLPR